MPYILRHEDGSIFRASTRAIHGAELVPHSHPDVVKFLRDNGQNPQQVEDSLAELRRTDGEMARAVEDIIMVLLKKNIIKLSDLPKAVQDRMALRVKLRVLLQDVYDQASGHKSG